MSSMSLIKQALRTLRHESTGRTPQRVNTWFKWLSPGLLVKRWLLLSAGGVLLTSLGVAIWVKLTPIAWFIQFVGKILEQAATIVPSFISGPIALLSGLFLIF